VIIRLQRPEIVNGWRTEHHDHIDELVQRIKSFQVRTQKLALQALALKLVVYSPWKRGLPVSISHRIQPPAHMSILVVFEGDPNRDSGALRRPNIHE
jgi:hypothetical protein